MAGRLERITPRQAGERKGCTRQAINYAVRAGHLDAEKAGPYNLIVTNARFDAWEPNRKIQAAGRASAKKAGKKVQKTRKA